MANNRMYLVHKSSGTAILLAKYYPSTGWGLFHLVDKYNSFFDKFNPRTTFGDTSFELRYEIVEDKESKELVGDENFPFNHPGFK